MSTTETTSHHTIYRALGFETNHLWLCEACAFQSQDDDLAGRHAYRAAHMPKWFDELGVREILHEMAELREHAEVVARLVFQLRWPKWGISPSLDVDLKWTLEEGTVDVHFYASRSGDESFDFPLHYLWSDRETIEAAEQALAEANQRKAAEKAATEEAERQRVRRAQYERLKAEFGE